MKQKKDPRYRLSESLSVTVDTFHLTQNYESKLRIQIPKFYFQKSCISLLFKMLPTSLFIFFCCLEELI